MKPFVHSGCLGKYNTTQVLLYILAWLVWLFRDDEGKRSFRPPQRNRHFINVSISKALEWAPRGFMDEISMNN